MVMNTPYPPAADRPATEARCTVYYDGACPLCQREIALYRRSEGAEQVEWVDVSQPHAPLPANLSRAAALTRFHVRDASGQLLSGAAGFAGLWRQLPQWRWLGQWAGRAPLVWVLEGAYRVFLPVRPWLQQLVRTWERR